MSTPTTHSTQSIADFRRKFAAALVAIHEERTMDEGALAELLASRGLPKPKRAGSTTVAVEVPAEDPKISGDVKFSDLNEAAQQRVLARQLQQLMRDAYRYFKRQVDNGTWKLEQVLPHLRALGLLEPTTTTTISGTVYDEDGDEIFVHTQVEGQVTQEQAQAAMDAQSHGSRERNAALALATALGTKCVEVPAKASGVSATEHTVWADASNITVEGAEEPTE